MAVRAAARPRSEPSTSTSASSRPCATPTASRCRRATCGSRPRNARARSRFRRRSRRASRPIRAGGDPVAAARAVARGARGRDYVTVADFHGQPTLAIAARVGTHAAHRQRPARHGRPASPSRHVHGHVANTEPSRRTGRQLAELAVMKPRGEKIAVVTAYDAPERAPRRRRRHRLRPGRRLGGDDGARPRVDDGDHRRRDADADARRRAAARRARSSSPTCRSDRFRCRTPDGGRNAVRFVKEGGRRRGEARGRGADALRVSRALVDAGIPVMGHIGLTPQSATMLGGYKPQGRTADTGAAAAG